MIGMGLGDWGDWDGAGGLEWGWGIEVIGMGLGDWDIGMGVGDWNGAGGLVGDWNGAGRLSSYAGNNSN